MPGDQPPFFDLETDAGILRTLVDGFPIAIGIATKDGVMRHLNHSFIAAFGYTLDDIPTFTDWYDKARPDSLNLMSPQEFWQRLGEESAANGGYSKPRMLDFTTREGRPVTIEQTVVFNGEVFLGFFNDVTKRMQEQQRERAQSAFQQAVIENAAQGVCACHAIDKHPFVHFTLWNPQMTEITGYTIDRINANGWYQSLYPDEAVRARAIARMDRMREGDNMIAEEWVITRADGMQRTVAISTSLIKDDQGRGNVLAIMQDVTPRKRAESERRKLEAQVQHAQKLESLGVLAGGIAHDFNNILMAVLGRANLASLHLDANHQARNHLEEIEKAAHGAADLCRQMLAYSGKGRFLIETLDLRTIVEEMTRMLEVSLGKKVVLKYKFAENLPAVRADATQLRQVIMNLITNASEAIAERSGVISLSTGAMHCDKAYLSETYLDENLEPGLYVYVEVADTGCGMDEAVRCKMFEPFYTTKFTGRGLGMAAVLGIIRGHRGAIKVYSEPNRGTTVKVLFPAVDVAPEAHDPTLTADVGFVGAGTILFVDDEETICALGREMLNHLGFDVLIARDGREALDIYRAQSSEIACVILDLTMPHMDGEEAFRELRRINPGVCVLMSSGYNQQEVTQRFAGKGLAGFIQKPYQLRTLQAKLAEIL